VSHTGTLGATDPRALRRAVELFRAAPSARNVALTGAGISIASGLPDLEGARRALDGYQWVTTRRFLESEEARIRYWQHRHRMFPRFAAASPNPAHRALERLGRLGLLGTIVTQNGDDLNPPGQPGGPEVIRLSGTLFATRCLRCGATIPTAAVLAAWPEPLRRAPACDRCRGPLRIATLAWDQSPDEALVARARTAARAAGVLLVVGHSLRDDLTPDLVRTALAAGARLVLVNPGRTALDDAATVRLADPAELALPALLDALGDGRATAGV
jgi:NAD-dependent deacetylase